MKQKLVLWAARWFAGGVMREVAEGKRGPTLRRWYWAAAGVKTVTAFVLGVLYAALCQFEPATALKIEPIALGVIGVLAAAGVVDKGWRSVPPPAWWGPALSKVLSWGPALSLLVALAVELLPRVPHCPSCSAVALQIQAGAAAVATSTGWLAARYSQPPAISE